MIEKLLIKKYRVRISFILLLSCFSTLVNADHGIWVAKKGEQQITIVAITAYIKPAQWPLPTVYQKVLDEAEQVVVEHFPEGFLADIGIWYAGQKFMLPKGESLKEKVSTDVWNKLLTYKDKSAIFDEEMLQDFSPLATCALLYIVEVESLGYTFQLPNALYCEAKQQNKVILSLNWLLKEWGYVQAVDKLDTTQYLSACLENVRNKNPTAAEFMEAVYQGDLEQLNKWYFESEFIKLAELQKLVKHYIAIDAKKIDEFSQNGKPTLVYMSVERLLGEQGLLKLLEEKGYQISRYQE